MSVHPLELYSAYLDGHCLSDAEVAQLRAWIDADARNLDEFIQFAHVHAAITDRLVLCRLLDDLAWRREPAIITPEALAEALQEIEADSPRLRPEITPATPTYQGRPMVQALAPLAAAIAFVCFVGWASWHFGGQVPIAAADRGRVPASQPTPAPQPPLAPEPVLAGRIGTSLAARWSGNETRPPGEMLYEGERLELLSGVVQLDMANGATAVIEGPSRLEMVGADSLLLEQGKAAVRMDGLAKSFVVHTPTTQVIDLGTEFGVGASPSGETLVSVFDGSVAIADPGEPLDRAGDRRDAPGARRLNAGFEVSVGPHDRREAAAWLPQAVENDRAFVRPDEVEVRVRARAGSLPDQKLAAHFTRRRIEGLLAYQGFDAPSRAADYALGMGGVPTIADAGAMAFVDDAGGAAGAVDIWNGPVFMGLDVSAEGPFGQAGLLAPSGRIGRTGAEIWLMWRTRRVTEEVSGAGSAGVSLMFGQRSDLDEPLFVGRASGERSLFSTESAWGGAPPPAGRRVNAAIDADRQTPGVQQFVVDQQEHVWLARLEFNEGADRASVWLDPDLANVDTSASQGVLDVADGEFDQIRLAVNRGDEVWRFREFAAALDPRVFEQLAQVAEFRAER